MAALGLLFTAHLAPMTLTVNLETVPIVDPIEIKKQEWMFALAKCESGGNDTIKVWDTNSKWSVGRYQYQYSTWLKYSKRFGTTRENITNGELQDEVTRYVLDTTGSGDWYNCAKAIKKSLGEYPSQVTVGEPIMSSASSDDSFDILFGG